MSVDRKEQIVSAAIERLSAVGFEGFRLGDIAKAVGINNATLIHHYPNKVALIKAVVETFTQRFEAVADAASPDGAPSEKLKRHMLSSVELMRASPEMFVVLNEIMIRAHRDPEISQLLSVPLMAWKQHIVSLLALSAEPAKGSKTEEIAQACMAQLLGMSLLLNSTNNANSSFASMCDQAISQAITALSNLVEKMS